MRYVTFRSINGLVDLGNRLIGEGVCSILIAVVRLYIEYRRKSVLSWCWLQGEKDVAAVFNLGFMVVMGKRTVKVDHVD